MQTLEQLQSAAKERSEELGFIKRKGGLLGHFPVKGFLAHALAERLCASPHVEKREGQIVFIDGVFDQRLSDVPKPCVLLPMRQAFLTYGALLRHRITEALKSEYNPFAAYGRQSIEAGAFLYIPPKEQLSAPLTVLHVNSGSGQRHLNLHCYAGSLSKAQVIVRTESEGTHWVNHTLEGVVEPGAEFEVLSMPHQSGWHSTTARFDIKKDTNMTVANFCKGSEGSFFDAQVSLLEENANANFFGLATLDGKSESHMRCEMRHLAPHCTSNQHIKSIDRDRSRFSFDGNIYVDAIAQKTDAYQMNNNLLLSRDSTAYSKPGLEIFADDVKASHGSTTGQLREDELLYLMTRGLSREVSMGLLVNAFGSEIIDQIGIEEVKGELGKAMLGQS